MLPCLLPCLLLCMLGWSWVVLCGGLDAVSLLESVLADAPLRIDAFEASCCQGGC